MVGIEIRQKEFPKNAKRTWQAEMRPIPALASNEAIFSRGYLLDAGELIG
jgi:hypothetical protein